MKHKERSAHNMAKRRMAQVDGLALAYRRLIAFGLLLSVIFSFWLSALGCNLRASY